METSDLDNVSNSVTIQSAQSCDNELIKFSNFCLLGEKRLQDRNRLVLAVYGANEMQLTRIHRQIAGPSLLNNTITFAQISGNKIKIR